MQINGSLAAELQILFTTPKAKAPAWRAATNKWLTVFQQASPADWAHFPEPARHLALALRLRPNHYGGYGSSSARLPSDIFKYLIQQTTAQAAIYLPDGTPFRIEPDHLRLTARPQPDTPDRLVLTLSLPDGTALPPQTPSILLTDQYLHLWRDRLWLGPASPPATSLPVAALADPEIVDDLHTLDVTLPEYLQARFQTVSLPPFLRLWVENSKYDPDSSTLRATLHARSDQPPCAQEWSGYHGWRWLPPGPPQPTAPDAPSYRIDLASAKAVGARLGEFRFSWWDGDGCWARPIGRDFPEEFIGWRATLPADLKLEVSPELAGLLGAPIRAHLAVTASPATEAGRDWFDLHLEFKVEDLTLTPEEIALLLKARGKWVRLPSRGWQRLQVASDESARVHLARLGLSPEEDLTPGQRSSHRFHALQLADAALADEALTTRLRARAAELRALPPPPLPAGLRADLRPYQLEGYHFLAHLSAQGLGGVLADDMGLGKTVQTLAWLLRLAAEISHFKSEISNGATVAPTTFRALVVCPKSVVPNWRNEALRFAPSLSVAVLSASDPSDSLPSDSLLVLNYAQLRLRADLLATIPWHAVILDEGQNIKNPASATARAACALPARHRLVLTGTPIENRLLDLWSLLHFAQPGLLGSQASFQRLYNDKTDPEARSRLATRARPFLLRRTKGQVAKDLPPRIEEEIECELEGTQRALYDAELKRARQMLVAVKTARQFDAQRFNILQSLLRLRQICCDPRLVGLDPATDQTTAPKKRGRPSKKAAAAAASTAPAGAKIEALIETLEPLVAEGHRVLVFSQFVTMLELIRAELVARDIDHLLLTGQTENRQELVDRFQAPDGPPVFLLSLKAAGAGLNLTAASYVVLFDPWWNPAVEAQAIDRTHRIGQAHTVIAYRLIAKDTVEQKIRALQREKAALAAAVVQEESLATVMDLENLRRILA